jgi:hypothetical protein
LLLSNWKIWACSSGDAEKRREGRCGEGEKEIVEGKRKKVGK